MLSGLRRGAAVFLCATGVVVCNKREDLIKGNRENKKKYCLKTQNTLTELKSMLNEEARLNPEHQMLLYNFLIHLGVQILYTIINPILCHLKLIPYGREK